MIGAERERQKRAMRAKNVDVSKNADVSLAREDEHDERMVASFAAGGLLMSPLSIRVIALLVATTLAFTLAMDSIKLAVFARVRID
jgi:hypothetical protein